MINMKEIGAFHYGSDVASVARPAGAELAGSQVDDFTYTFENFFHPLVGELIARLNRKSLLDVLDAQWQASLSWFSLNQNPDSPPSEDFDSAWRDSSACMPN